jgi:2-polyprenyl-6-methoxyphenol hydroxylase-like FAD-dependent oxidoreductase
MRRVLVVGAGRAGSAIALLVVKRGIDVLLVEREHDFDRAFRGEVLMPGGVDALRQMGVWPQVAQLPHAVVPTMELFVSRRVVRADWKELAGEAAARAFNQSVLIELLVD